MATLATETYMDSATLWFLDSLVEVRASKANGEPVSAMEITVPPGDTAPLHLQDEDERIYVLAGSATFYVGDEVHHVRPGEKVFIPKGRLHTHHASDFGARWIVLTESGHFEDFVRAVSRQAPVAALPPRSRLAWEDAEDLARIGLEHGIEYFGPPGTLPTDL
jgi:quercetin dioxygenase-like cupin family protein